MTAANSACQVVTWLMIWLPFTWSVAYSTPRGVVRNVAKVR